MQHTLFHFTVSLSENDGTQAELIAGRGRMRHFADITVSGLGKDSRTEARPDHYEFELSHARIAGTNILEIVLWDRAAGGKLWAEIRAAVDAHLQKAFEPKPVDYRNELVGTL